MSYRLACLLGFLSFFSLSAFAQPLIGPIVRMDTVVGPIDVELFPDRTPLTVANFLNYMKRGAYDNTIFHRSVGGFIIQGGGYRWENGQQVAIPEDPPVKNEYRISNTQGTIAMAKIDGDPDSATSQWFFNTANNSETLNGQNGGFTVFGRVASQANLARVLQINRLETGANDIPLLSGTTPSNETVVLVRSIRQIPFISSNGVITAGGFGGGTSAAPGSFIEIYGNGLTGEDDTRTWAASDFVNGKAPTTLNEVSVDINGIAAYVYFVSPNQVNVQVPDGVPAGQTVNVTVTHKGVASAAGRLTIKPVSGGLLAPASFKVDGRQYVVAMRADGSFVSNGKIPNVPAAPAVPGETIVLYGTGFGPVGSAPVAGQVAEGPTTITTPFRITIGTEAQVDYKGLAPTFVGLYQFNVVVPAGAQSGDLPVVVTLGSETSTQSLYLPIR